MPMLPFRLQGDGAKRIEWNMGAAIQAQPVHTLCHRKHRAGASPPPDRPAPDRSEYHHYPYSSHKIHLVKEYLITHDLKAVAMQRYHDRFDAAQYNAIGEFPRLQPER